MAKTFDGRHPCSLCLKVQKDAQSHKDQKARSADHRVDYYYVDAHEFRIELAHLWTMRTPSAVSELAQSAIELPPPETAPLI